MKRRNCYCPKQDIPGFMIVTVLLAMVLSAFMTHDVPVFAASKKVIKNEIEIFKGQSDILWPSYAGLVNKKADWKIKSGKGIVKITKDGLYVKGIKTGKAVLVSSSGKKKAELSIRVSETPEKFKGPGIGYKESNDKGFVCFPDNYIAKMPTKYTYAFFSVVDSTYYERVDCKIKYEEYILFQQQRLKAKGIEIDDSDVELVSDEDIEYYKLNCPALKTCFYCLIEHLGEYEGSLIGVSTDIKTLKDVFAEMKILNKW